MTIGISPKAFLAAVFPALTTLLVTLINGAFSGFDANELRLAVIGLAASALAFVGAFIGQPGVVVPHVHDGPSSDDLLSPEARKRADETTNLEL